MLKMASWVIRSAMTLAAMVGLAAAGLVAAMFIPDVGKDESCELNTPYLVDRTSAAGVRLEVAVDPAGCDVDLPEGQVIHLEFKVEDAPVPQAGQSDARMDQDGSMHAVLPVDPRNTQGLLTVKVIGSVPGCDEDTAACAAWFHELISRIEVLNESAGGGQKETVPAADQPGHVPAQHESFRQPAQGP